MMRKNRRDDSQDSHFQRLKKQKDEKDKSSTQGLGAEVQNQKKEEEKTEQKQTFKQKFFRPQITFIEPKKQDLEKAQTKLKTADIRAKSPMKSGRNIFGKVNNPLQQAMQKTQSLSFLQKGENGKIVFKPLNSRNQKQKDQVSVKQKDQLSISQNITIEKTERASKPSLSPLVLKKAISKKSSNNEKAGKGKSDQQEINDALPSFLPPRDSVNKMQCNLYELVDVLEQAFKYMDQAHNKDVVFCVGYTGSGKSTLLSYLMFGPQGLKEDTIKHFVGINKDKEKKKKVISNSVDSVFKIGHSDTESETFLPSFCKDEKSNLLFCDIAGFGDSGQHLIQLINVLTLQYLVNNVKSYRILLLFTYNQFKEMRGQMISQLVQESINLVETDPQKINGYASVFLPLISTKKILKSYNFDIEQQKLDLQDVIDKQIFERQADSFDHSLDLQTSTVNNISIQSTNDGMATQIESKTFSQKFSERLILFDPLEKPFPNEEMDQTTKHEELMEMIYGMNAFRRFKDKKKKKGNEFKQLQMSYELEIKLDQMFNELECEVSDVRTRHENHVRTHSQLLKPLFTKDPQIKKMKTIYNFFTTHNFFSEQQSGRQIKFLNHINEVQLSLENIQFYQNQQEHVPNEFESLLDLLILQDYQQIVPKLIVYYKLIEKLKFELNQNNMNTGMANITQIDSSSMSLRKFVYDEYPDKNQQLIIVAEAYLQVILDRIVSDQNNLHMFAYELRKADTETNSYTKLFLVGRVKPILLDLYISNVWHKSDKGGKMLPKEDVYFQIKQGQFNYVQYIDQLGDQVVNLIMGSKQKNIFQFQMVEDGFEILPVLSKQDLKIDLDDQRKRVMPQQDQYDSNKNEVWIKRKEIHSRGTSFYNKRSMDQTTFKWKLNPKSDQEDSALFYFEVAQPGRQNPRLMSVVRKTAEIEASDIIDAPKGLIVSRKYVTGEKHDACALWEVTQYEKPDNFELDFESNATNYLTLELLNKTIDSSSMYQSVTSKNGDEQQLYELLLSYTLVIERQIPSHDLNENFYIKVKSKLRNILFKIFESGSVDFEQPTSIFLKYLQKGFIFQKIQQFFFDYFGKIEKEAGVPNEKALKLLRQLIDHHIEKVIEDLGTCTLVDVQNFLHASLLIYCKIESPKIEMGNLLGDVSQNPVRDDATANEFFLQKIDDMVPQRQYLNSLLVQDRMSNVQSVLGTSKSKRLRRNTVNLTDPANQNIWKQPKLWIELIVFYIDEEFDQLQDKQKKQNIFKKVIDIFKGRDTKKEKLNKYRIIVRCLHSIVLKFGLPREVIQQIIFAPDFQLKSSEVKQLNIYLDMVYYWKGLSESPIGLIGSSNSPGLQTAVSELPEEQSLSKLDESYVEYIFQDKDSLWFKQQKQIKMVPNTQLEYINRGEKWLQLMTIRDHYHELNLDMYQNTEANWKKICGNNHLKQVNNMMAYKPFSVTELKSMSIAWMPNDDEGKMIGHVDTLNLILKAFAVKQGIKVVAEIEKFKELTIFAYSIVGMNKNGNVLSSQDDADLQSVNIVTQFSSYENEVQCQRAFKLLVHLANMDGLREMIYDPDDFVLRFLLYEFDCLLAIHLPNLHRHFSENDMSWCVLFGRDWFKRMLLGEVFTSISMEQLQTSNACVLEMWDTVIEACRQKDFVPWTYFHQLGLYVLALHQQCILQLSDSKSIHEFLQRATTRILLADSEELDRIERYYLSASGQSDDDKPILPYWQREKQIEETMSFESGKKGKRKMNTEDAMDPRLMASENASGKAQHIIQRLGICLSHDRFGKPLDMIEELSMFRKDLLNVHVKKNNSYFKFPSFKISKSARPKKDSVDPYDIETMNNNTDFIDLQMDMFNTQPFLLSDTQMSGMGSQNSKEYKDKKKGCELVLRQIYDF